MTRGRVIGLCRIGEILKPNSSSVPFRPTLGIGFTQGQHQKTKEERESHHTTTIVPAHPNPHPMSDLYSFNEAESLLASSNGARSGSSSSRRRQITFTTPRLTWSETLTNHLPQIALGVTLALVGVGIAWVALTSDGSKGRKGRNSKGKNKKGGGGGKLQARDLYVTRERTHGLILDDPDHPRTPVGLRNIGNSCWFNALLQAIQGSAPFLDYLSRLHSIAFQIKAMPIEPLAEALNSTQYETREILRTQVEPAYEFLTSLLDLLVPQSSSSSSSLNPLHFYNLVISASSHRIREERGQQQDAHELFGLLVEQLEGHAKRLGVIQEQVIEMVHNEKRGFETLMEAPMPPTKANATPATSAAVSANQAPALPVSQSLCDTDSEASPSASPPITPNLESSIEGDNQTMASAAVIVSAPSSSSTSSPSPSPSSSSTSPSSSPNPPPGPDPVKALTSPGLAFLPEPFHGTQAQFLLCNTCRSSSSAVNHIPFTSLTLNFHSHSFGQRSSSSDSFTLESLLRTFVHFEQVEGVRCANCKEDTRYNLVRSLLREVESLPLAKGPKSTRKRQALIELLTRCDAELHHRRALLQPTSGKFLQLQRQQQLERELKAMQSGDIDHLPTVDPFAPSLLPSAPSAAPSPSPSPDMDFFQSLQFQLHDPDFLDTIPTPFHDRLVELCSIDIKRTFSKGSALVRLPPSICFHLNRLVGNKITTLVSFPLEINMWPFTSSYAYSEVESHILANSGSNAARWTNLSRARDERPYMYELDAVVVHQGGSSGGHYIAYRRHVQRGEIIATSSSSSTQLNSSVQFVADDSESPSSPSPFAASSPSINSSPDDSVPLRSPDVITWWRLNDAYSHQVDIDEVLKSQAYLLIYTKVYQTKRHN